MGAGFHFELKIYKLKNCAKMRKEKEKIMGTFDVVCIVIALIIGMAMMYLALSIKKFSAEFVFMKLRFGKPIPWRGQVDGVKKGGGLGIVWAFIDSFYAFPTVLDRIDLDQQVITTKARSIKGVEFSAIDNVQVDAIFYFRWPSTFESMRRAYTSAPPSGIYPNGVSQEERAELKDFVEKSLQGIIRRVLGDESWYEVRTGESSRNKVIVRREKGEVTLEKGEGQNGEETTSKINDLINAEIAESRYNPISETGWEHTYVEIAKALIPEGISKAMSQPQIAFYEAEAKKKMAEALAFEKSRVAEAIRALGEAGSLVYTWDKLAEAAQGPSNTIVMQIPASLTRFIEQKTGFQLSDVEMATLAKKMGKIFNKGGN